MSRTLFYPRAILSVAALTTALLGTACSDSTGPSTGTEGSDGTSLKSQVQGIPGEGAADTGPSADFAIQAPVPVGADGIAQIGFRDASGRTEALPMGARVGDVIASQFVVLFKDDVKDVPGLAKRLVAEHGGKLRLTFVGIKGFSATLPAGAAEALRRNPKVSLVEPNSVGAPQATQYMNTGSGQSWGLDRIDQRARPLSGTMSYSHTGRGVFAYIIDTGIRSNHPEFGGRARNVATAFGDAGEDCHSHGTHVAGIVGGKTYGVAKQVQLRGVKVLDCAGNSTVETATSGVDWVLLHRTNPAVANISLGFPKNTLLNIATARLANSGVFVAVAAGNENQDACLTSPAVALGAFTVASSNATDGRASSSNWGRCVDLYAPGVQILSAGLTTYWSVKSGTSMATPHVVGVAALFKQAYGNVASATIGATLKSWATRNVISSGAIGSTPNLLLYKGGL